MFRFNDTRNLKTIINDEVLFHLNLNTRTRQCDLIMTEEMLNKVIDRAMEQLDAAAFRQKLDSMTHKDIVAEVDSWC